MQLLSIMNAAKFLDVKPRTIKYWIDQGTLRYKTYGKHIRIEKSDLIAFGKEHKSIEAS